MIHFSHNGNEFCLVPCRKDSYDFKVSDSLLTCRILNPKGAIYAGGYEELPEGVKWTLLGTLKDGKVDFQPDESWVDQRKDPRWTDRFWNYLKNEYDGQDIKNSFASLLTSKIRELIGPKPPRKVPFMHAGFETDRDREALREYDQDLKAWQSFISGSWCVLISQKNEG